MPPANCTTPARCKEIPALVCLGHMENDFAQRRDSNFFALSTLFLSALVILALTFSLAGLFYAIAITASFGAAAFVAFLRWKKQSSFKIRSLLPSRQVLLILGLSLLFAIFISKTSEPTVFTGRDQGSIATAAISLAQNHSWQTRSAVSDVFFQIYGPGKALNFPGYYYTAEGALLTQFPLPYITYLALFYGTLGMGGFAVANGLLLVFSALSFFLATRSFLGAKYAYLAVAFLFSLLPFSWFFKFTLTETMAFALLWSSLALAADILKNGARKLSLSAFLSSLAVLALTRIEGAAFGAMLLLAVLHKKENRAYLKEKMGTALLVMLPFAALFLVFYIAKDIYFFREVFKGFFNSWLPSPSGEAQNIFRSSLMEPAAYITQVHLRYGTLPFFLLGALGIISALCKRKYGLLLPVLATLPAFLYFIDSHISSDHPWMLRRFMFALLPAFVYASALLLKLWEQRSTRHALGRPLTVLVAAGLIAQALVATVKILPGTENEGLLTEIAALAQNFSPKDLVLVDRDASGDGWSMLSGPFKEIYGLNAAYFFNSNDLERLDTSAFDNIYLITPRTNATRWKALLGDRIVKEKPYSLEVSRLEVDPKAQKKVTVSLPRKHAQKIEGYVLEIQGRYEGNDL